MLITQVLITAIFINPNGFILLKATKKLLEGFINSFGVKAYSA
jgi:hypothetical protein